MFKYYSKAVVCYAYLSDVQITEDREERRAEENGSEHDAGKNENESETKGERIHGEEREKAAAISRTLLEVSEPIEEVYQQFCQSRWFTRGWTLQELIAPTKLMFYDRHWRLIGDKIQLEQVLEECTSIDRNVLRDYTFIESTSVAKRMSWASSRSTTREEDEAYCLLGIFDVNMPLLYGEGKKAFQRLQEEIIRTSRSVDHSILYWKPWLSKHKYTYLCDCYGPSQLLSPSTYGFRSCGYIESWSTPAIDTFELSPRGLRVTLPVSQISSGDSGCKLFVAQFNFRSSEFRWSSVTLLIQERPSIPALLPTGSIIRKLQSDLVYDLVQHGRALNVTQDILAVELPSGWETRTITLARNPFESRFSCCRIHITGSCYINFSAFGELIPGYNFWTSSERSSYPSKGLVIWDGTCGVLDLVPADKETWHGSGLTSNTDLHGIYDSEHVSIIVHFRMRSEQIAPPLMNVSIAAQGHWLPPSITESMCYSLSAGKYLFGVGDRPVLQVSTELVSWAAETIWSFTIDWYQAPEPQSLGDVHLAEEEIRQFDINRT